MPTVPLDRRGASAAVAALTPCLRGHAQEAAGPANVIVVLDSSLLPDPASYPDSEEGDRLRTADVRALQDKAISRALAPGQSPDDLHESHALRLMDFIPAFMITVGRHERAKLAADPAVARVHAAAAPFEAGQ